MKKYLSVEEKEIYRRTSEILYYIWDPIQLNGAPEARDEYDSYLPKVFSKLVSDNPKGKIVEYLIKVEVGSMGISPSKEKAIEIEQLLIDTKEWVFEYGS